jgi:predicted alpha/beta hydrolase
MINPNSSKYKIMTKDNHIFDLETNYYAECSSIILILPALGVRASFYKTLVQEFCKNKMSVMLMNLRGNGDSSVKVTRGVHFGFNEIINHDIASAVDYISKTYPKKKIYLMGHSLGGQLACLYASKFPQKISGIILAASCTVYYKVHTNKLKILIQTQLVRAVTESLGYFPGKRIGFAGTESVGVMRDWSNNALNGEYIVDGDTTDFGQKLLELKTSVLALSFEGDNLAPRTAVQDLTGRMPKSRISVKHYYPTDLAQKELNHFCWAKTPKPLISEITNWLTSL